MRAVCLQKGFGLENLVVEERPEPTPGPGELLLAVRVAALNFRDVSLARGTYDPHLAHRVILGCDAVGEVVACGPDVSRFAVGDRVCPTVVRGWHEGPPTRNTARQMLGGPLDGTLAERIVTELDYVGVMGVATFVFHVFFPARASASIGWAMSPFEYEVGIADLTVGALGILCIWLRENFWLATAIANAVWLLGDAVGHVRQMVEQNNHAQNNSGIFLILEFLMPPIILALTLYSRRQTRVAA